MSSNSRAKAHVSSIEEILEAKNKITELHTIIRSMQGPQIGSRQIGGTARSASITDGLKNPDVVIVGIMSYDVKLVNLTSTTLDISKSNNGLPGTVDGFSSRIVLANSAANDLETIAGTEHAGQYLELQGVVTESITIKDGVGNIRTQTGNDVVITGNQIARLRFDSIANEWVVVVIPTSDISFIGFVADADLDMGTFDIINVDRYLPVIDSGAFPSSSTAGILRSGIGLHYNVANLKTHKFQVEESDQLVVTNVPSIGIALQGNDLTEVDEFFFTTVGTFISHDAGGIHSNVPTGDIFDWFINSLKEFEVRSGEINVHGNDIAGIDDLFFDAGQELRSTSVGFEFRYPLNDLEKIFFNGVQEYEISPTAITFFGNRIDDLSDLTSNSLRLLMNQSKISPVGTLE